MERHDNVYRDSALLAARIALGASIAAHGAQKLFGWFGGPGKAGATKMMESLGFDPPEKYATLASATEIASGALIALGLGSAAGPAMLASTMTVAAGSVHVKNGFFNTDKGFELNAIYTIGALLLAVEGPGRLSLDQAIGLRKLRVPPLVDLTAIAGGVAMGLVILSQRRPPAPQARSAAQNGKPKEEPVPAGG